MKRVNLILTTEQYLILQKKSHQYGIPKAHYLRNLIEQKINEQIDTSLKVNIKNWKLFGGVTFNLRVITPIYDWLEKTSFLANCSKSDLIRHIIDLDSKVAPKKLLYYSTKNEVENILQNNITSLISTKQYSGLNKYISTVHPNKIINLGNPHLINEAISGIESAGVYVNNKTKILNAQMHWFLGDTEVAIKKLSQIIKQKDPQYHYRQACGENPPALTCL